jgi:hypothetical protein
VLVDLRGTGASVPSPACPEVDGAALLAAPSRDVAARRRSLGEVAACRARLRQEGVDLRAYDYAEMAADLADLRRALGIGSWTLPHARRAFDAFFGASAADPGCAAAHPDLAARFAALVERLRNDPVAVTVPDGGSGAPRTVVIDDAVALEALHGALYDSSLIPLIPTIIDQLVDGVDIAFSNGLFHGPWRIRAFDDRRPTVAPSDELALSSAPRRRRQAKTWTRRSRRVQGRPPRTTSPRPAVADGTKRDAPAYRRAVRRCPIRRAPFTRARGTDGRPRRPAPDGTPPWRAAACPPRSTGRPRPGPS